MKLIPSAVVFWTLFRVAASAGAAETTLDEIVKQVRDETKMPAMAAAVVRGDRIVASAASGVRKNGDETPVTLQDKFHIGSITKSMTASLAAMLVEEGKIRWETKISEIFTNGNIHEKYRDVTLEQLLSHRAGFPGNAPADLWSEAWAKKGSVARQRERFVQGLLEKGPEVEPGTRYLYSNQGYSVAGAMLEKVSGKQWESLIAERLFKPLKMKSAGFGAPATHGKVDQPWGHSSGGSPVDPDHGDNPPAIGPAGIVHCSIEDLARYASFQLRGDEGKGALLKPESFEQLHRARTGQDYALGWIVTSRPWADGRVLVHNGSNTMFFAVVWIAPKKDFAVVVATNQGGEAAEKAVDQIASRAIQAYLK